MHAAYPTALDLQTELENCGLFSSDWNLNLERAVEAAREAWELDTDWAPYLADAEETTRRFTARGVRKVPVGAFVGVPSSIRIGDTTFQVGDGERDVSLRTLRGEPDVTTALEFVTPVFSPMNGLIVRAKFGRVAMLPETVWDAVLQRAALNLGTQIRTRKTAQLVEAQNAGAVIKAKESGPVRIEYQVIDGLKSIDWNATFAGWANAYSDALDGRVMRQP